MGATSRTGIISAIYKFKVHKSSNPQKSYGKTLNAITGENQSVAAKLPKTEQYCTHFPGLEM